MALDGAQTAGDGWSDGTVPPPLAGELSGVFQPADIPAAPGYDLAALKANDKEPVEVVVAIPAAVSTRRWKYTPAAMQAIVAHVQAHGLPGFLGHQKAEDLAHQFPDPVTHWIGAVWRPEDGDEGTAYVRGVVDPGAPKLKRWLKARTVRQVSIYGRPQLRRRAGGRDGAHQEVVGYDPLSLDWTPLNRAGMPTRVVALGEVAAQPEDAGAPEGGAEEDQEMTLGELLAELRKLDATPAQVIGELRWPPEAVGAAIAVDVRAAGAALAERGQVREALGLPADAPAEAVLRAVAAGTEAVAAEGRRAQEALVERVVGELVDPACGRPLVRRLLAPKLPPGADEAQIRGAVAGLLSEEDVKATLDALGSAPAATDPPGEQAARPAPAAPSGQLAAWTTPRPAADNRAPAAGQLPAGFRWDSVRI